MNEANPNFAKAVKEKNLRQEELLKRQQRQSLLNQILSERRQGLIMTKIPHDLLAEV